jgi:hypothetical protein
MVDLRHLSCSGARDRATRQRVLRQASLASQLMFRSRHGTSSFAPSQAHCPTWATQRGRAIQRVVERPERRPSVSCSQYV